MGLTTPAPVSIPFWNQLEAPPGSHPTIVTSSEHQPAITLIRGIDLTNPGFFEGSNCLIQTFNQTEGQLILFQAFVYAQSQASFSWRGELPLFTGTSLLATAVAGTWDINVWGVVIPFATLAP